MSTEALTLAQHAAAGLTLVSGALVVGSAAALLCTEAFSRLRPTFRRALRELAGWRA